MSLLAARSGTAIPGTVVHVSIAFGRDPNGLYKLKAEVRIHMGGIDRSIVEELVRNTESICPYTKMTNRGITSIVALTNLKEPT